MNSNSLASLNRFLTNHPISSKAPLHAWMRVVHWQVRSRITDEVVVDWIGGAKFAARRGMTGFTGNIYAGLHEAVDMLFVLNFLRPGDVFADIGANVGSYTVLASAVASATTVAIEPDPDATKRLRRNIDLNGLEALVSIREVAVGAVPGEARLTVGRDTVNTIVEGADGSSRTVTLETVDRLFASGAPAMLKMDIEGYEGEAIKGASQTLADPRLKAVALETSDREIEDTLSNAGFSRAYYNIFTRRLMETPNQYRASNQLFVRDHAEVASRLQSANPVRIRGLCF
jgi:FkbM family methyltransferase